MEYTCIKDQIQNLNLVIGCSIGCSYCYARNNARRYHTTDDFEKPEFFSSKLRLMDKKKPHVFLLTGTSDLSGWRPEWRDLVFEKIQENPQHHFLFLSKRPDLLDIRHAPDNTWFGVTVTGKADLWRIDALRRNVSAKHYHVTFEPLFDDPGEVELSGIDWIVIGTMTGAQSRKIKTNPMWVQNLTDRAHRKNVSVFWKEDLSPIMGTETIVQELPIEFQQVLEAQKTWQK